MHQRIQGRRKSAQLCRSYPCAPGLVVRGRGSLAQRLEGCQVQQSIRLLNRELGACHKAALLDEGQLPDITGTIGPKKSGLSVSESSKYFKIAHVWQARKGARPCLGTADALSGALLLVPAMCTRRQEHGCLTCHMPGKRRYTVPSSPKPKGLSEYVTAKSLSTKLRMRRTFSPSPTSPLRSH